ncbi:MAG: TonB-dependent receptor [Candidatus Synoicihabitans palmerolidicus]|nr:TonB-dependent receptor [Candidatus Synoicihabitans palmerolidicus]
MPTWRPTCCSTTTDDRTPPTAAKHHPRSTTHNSTKPPPNGGYPSGEEAALPPLLPSIIFYSWSEKPETITINPPDLSNRRGPPHFTENPGTTRPTQELIDDGIYITGSSGQNGGTGNYYGNTFTPTGTVKIDGSQILLAPDDAADATVWNVQSSVTLELEGDRRLVNRSYLESVEAEKHSSYYFYSWLPTSYTAENRTGFVADFETGKSGGWKHETISGLSLRYEHRVSYVDIFNAVFNAFDVTMDPSTLVLPANQLYFVQPVPGSDYLATSGGRYPRPGRSDSTSLSATLDSELMGVGLFAQDQIHFDEKWSLLLAGRLDGVWVDTVDPLPRAGFDPVGDRIDAVLSSGTVSLIYKPIPKATLYATWNQAAAVEGSSSSGGFSLTNNQLRDETFENSSQLFEIGGTMTWWDDRLFVGRRCITKLATGKTCGLICRTKLKYKASKLRRFTSPTATSTPGPTSRIAMLITSMDRCRGVFRRCRILLRISPVQTLGRIHQAITECPVCPVGCSTRT